MQIWIFPLILLASMLEEPGHVDVFIGGEEGYHTYRIPALLTLESGVCLAFCEGRISKSDQASNDILLKRSLDNGLTWQALQKVASDGDNSLNNPTLLQEQQSGRVFLFYQRYPASRSEGTVSTGLEGDNICRSYVCHSDDDGLTWSTPEDLTSSIKRARGVTSLASGPGVGIQLHKGEHAGRLLMPFNQGPWGEWSVYAVYSDDRGESWQMGKLAPDNSIGRGNEVQFVELSDGRVMLNARSQGGHPYRKIAYSEDGGYSWTGLSFDPDLVEPQCMGSILRYDANTLIFANPASAQQRALGTLKYSKNEGDSWSEGKVIYPGSFAYSCLTRFGDGHIGLLYEKDNYAKITLARIDPDWLMEP